MHLKTSWFNCTLYSTYFFLLIAASYTYYKTLCQETSLERRGKIGDRKVQRRRKQRALTVSTNNISFVLFITYLQKLAKRQSTFQSSHFKSKEKWKSIMIQEMMSSEESGVDEEGKAVILVKDLPWRSDKLGRFFERLDAVQQGNRSEQAIRQSKERILIKATSERGPPRNITSIPRWAFRVNSDDAQHSSSDNDTD
jgi:hypothetical protein